MDDIRDPRHAGPRPPQPAQQQDAPGDTAPMNPQPDHGEASYRGSGRLKDRIAIVTGADSGIGRAVALAFAREGADVVIAYLEEEQDALATAKHVEDAGRRSMLIRGDIGEREHCHRLVKQVIDAFGRIDILVNNAAYQRSYEKFEDIPAEEWDRTFKTNVHGMFHLSQAAVPFMTPGSTIVNTASINAKNPSPHLLAYATTKGAIANFTAGLAGLLAGRGIRVNAVAPGPVWTPLIPSTMPAPAVEKFGDNVPLGRAAQPAELAPAYVLLASAESSYMTGAVIPVTGGRPML